MADGTRGQVAPLRKLVAIVLGTLATFVVLFGAGMTSWTIVALGVALLVLAVGLVAVTAVRTGARAWVAGVGHVHSVSEPPASANFGRCELQIVIDAPGVPPRSVKIRDPRVPVAKWPDPGATLPIMVAIDDQRHVRILWDEVLTHAEAATTDLPPEFDQFDAPDDGLLIDEEAPPWARREADDDLPPPDEPAAADLDDDLGGPRKEPVVMRQTAGGRIVLEGTLVNPAPSSLLPRRPRPGPDPDFSGMPQAPLVTESRVATEEAPPRAPGEAPLAGEVPLVEQTPRPRDAGRADRPADPEIDIDIDGLGGLGDPGRTGPAGAGWDDDRGWAGTGPDPAAGTTPAAGVDPGTGVDPDGGGDRDAGDLGPIHGVGITLLVADLDRSVAFYRDMLGFHEIDGGDGNAVLASGATRIVLRSIPDVAPVNRRLVHLNLEVADVATAYEDLRSKGIRFTYAPRAVNRGAKLELWAAAFRDPDGHGIALTQWRGR